MSLKAGWKKLVGPDSKVFSIDPKSVSYSVQNYERESVVAGEGRIGDTESSKVCFIECDVYLKAGQTVKMLNQEGVWQLEGRTRTVVLSEDANYHGDGVVGEGDKVKARFESNSAEEVFL